MTTINIPVSVTVTATKVVVSVNGSTTSIPVPAPTPIPVPTPTPDPPLRPLVVVSNGKNNWSGNYNWGGMVETDNATGPDGPAIELVSAQGGSPGFQPWYAQGGQNVPGATNFDTTGLSFLTFVLAPTQSGQQWQSGFEGQGDVAIPGASVVEVEKFGPVPVPGVYGTYKIPLGAGGYNLPSGQHILKFMLQDNSNKVGNINWVKSIEFS